MNAFEAIVLACFAAAALASGAGAMIGMRAIASRQRKASKTALKDMLANDYYEAVSVLVYAYNARSTVTESVRSMLDLQYPNFEVIVCNDGSTDATLEELTEQFSLVEVPVAHDEKIATERVVRMWKSIAHANLTVLDKECGGRGDALNAALNLARRPLIVAADAATRFDPQALIRMSRPFVEDERIIAVAADTGTGSRSSLARNAWSRLNAMTSLEGLSMLRRRMVAEAGGWSTRSDCPDVDLALRLHRNLKPKRRRSRIVFLPEQVSWTTEHASRATKLRRYLDASRDRTRALWNNRGMTVRPRYRFVGIAVVAQIWSNTVGPVIEISVWAYVVASAGFGVFHPVFAGLFAAITIGTRLVTGRLASGAGTAFGLHPAEHPRHHTPPHHGALAS